MQIIAMNITQNTLYDAMNSRYQINVISFSNLESQLVLVSQNIWKHTKLYILFFLRIKYCTSPLSSFDFCKICDSHSQKKKVLGDESILVYMQIIMVIYFNLFLSNSYEKLMLNIE